LFEGRLPLCEGKVIYTKLLTDSCFKRVEVRERAIGYIKGLLSVIDETGFLKKGRHLVGVKRQY